MKYTMFGFSQRAASDLNLDLTDLAILRWFVDFMNTGNMRSLMIDNEKYFGVFYQKVMEDIYIIGLKRDAIYNRFAKLCKAGVLKKKTVHYGGNYVYFALGQNYNSSNDVLDNLDNNPNANDFNSNMSELNCNLDDFDNNISNINPSTIDLNQNLSDFDSNPVDSDESSKNFDKITDDFDESIAKQDENLSEQNLEQIINLPNSSIKSISLNNDISPEFMLTKLMWKLLSDNYPTFKEPDFKDWTTAFSLILHKDNRDFREITELIEWIYTKDSFWSCQILDPWKLRKHYEMALARKIYEKSKSKAKSPSNKLLGDYELSEFKDI